MLSEPVAADFDGVRLPSCSEVPEPLAVEERYISVQLVCGSGQLGSFCQ
jgi:hypothetical protein